MQKFKHSMYEALINTFIGFIVSGVLNHYVFLFYDIELTVHENGVIVLLFTTVSIVRNLIIRRFFNWLHTRGYL